MTVLTSIGLFVLAAIAEIGGAYLVWQGVRERRGLIFIGAAVIPPRPLRRTYPWIKSPGPKKTGKGTSRGKGNEQGGEEQRS